MSNIGQGSGTHPAPLPQAPPPWYATGENPYQYPGYPVQQYPQPAQIELRTTTGLPWYLHVAYAFWAILTCGYGVKHWVRAWQRAKRVSHTRSR